jgi:hypothetical protein
MNKCICLIMLSLLVPSVGHSYTVPVESPAGSNTYYAVPNNLVRYKLVIASDNTGNYAGNMYVSIRAPFTVYTVIGLVPFKPPYTSNGLSYHGSKEGVLWHFHDYLHYSYQLGFSWGLTFYSNDTHGKTADWRFFADNTDLGQINGIWDNNSKKISDWSYQSDLIMGGVFACLVAFAYRWHL